MSRIYNFSAGPAALSEAVLKQVQDEMLEWNGTGASVMEVSHRGKPFMAAAAQAEQRRRRGREGDGGPFVLDENSVNTLVSMGFSEQRVKQTLHVTNNNIEAAMNMLLNEN